MVKHKENRSREQFFICDKTRVDLSQIFRLIQHYIENSFAN